MFSEKPLEHLAKIYFDALLKEYEKSYRIIDPPEEIKSRGLLNFIIYVEDTGERWGVLIKDWKKSIGSDLILRFKRVIDALELTAGIIIGNKISALAMDKAQRYGLLALTRGEIISYLYQRGYDKKPLSTQNN